MSAPDFAAIKRCKTGEWLERHLSTEHGEDCIEWPFSRTGGYGRVKRLGRTVRVHSLVLQTLRGSAPAPGLVCAHSCGNPPCVNVNHLRWATPAENSHDSIIHGTVVRGDRNGNAKLSTEQAIVVRRSSDPASVLAERFGVSVGTITDIRSGKRWAHLQGANNGTH